ncbi:zinc ribbon domain-containing protein [Psychromonas sp.]|uniref:zinc ribbon domain-containing protein n=1 Tax=Psychromonas sp. TaxID=1884585 RepID=UPI00356159FB
MLRDVAYPELRLVIAERWFASSKLCCDCGSHNPNLKLSDRTYNCSCGNSKCRDYNARAPYSLKNERQS